MIVQHSQDETRNTKLWYYLIVYVRINSDCELILNNNFISVTACHFFFSPQSLIYAATYVSSTPIIIHTLKRMGINSTPNERQHRPIVIDLLSYYAPHPTILIREIEGCGAQTNIVAKVTPSRWGHQANCACADNQTDSSLHIIDEKSLATAEIMYLHNARRMHTNHMKLSYLTVTHAGSDITLHNWGIIIFQTIAIISMH